MNELIYVNGDEEARSRMRRLQRLGKVRQVVPKVYATGTKETDAAIVKRNLWAMIDRLYPNSLLSHRSALEFQPSPEGVLYLTRDARRTIRWPGVTLKYKDGPPALTDDNPLRGSLRASSLERALLENLGDYRQSGGERRSVDQSVVEDRLAQVLNSRGEQGLNELRDRAREIAEELDWQKEFDRLNGLVAALLTTGAVSKLTSSSAVAIATGRPYDSARVTLFERLAGELRLARPANRPAKTTNPTAFRNFAFFESYFSNYIEGTTFRVDEARKIIDEGAIIPLRHEDSHDVRETFALCSDRREMQRTPASFDELVSLLRRRHNQLMHARPYLLPGAFKVKANRAGNTYFVHPKQVLGTLEQAFHVYRTLPEGYVRALFIMFVLSEVHPFEDGNGRIARLFMNAELTSAGQSKLIIPTIYRDDYLLNLRRLTRKNDAPAYLRMMDRAHAFSHWLDPADYDTLKQQLELSNAFEEEEAVLRFPS